MTPREIRWVASELADAIRAGAFGSRNHDHRRALSWALAYAPLKRCDAETRRAARAELTFLEAMSSRPRPLRRCAPPQTIAEDARSLPGAAAAS